MSSPRSDERPEIARLPELIEKLSERYRAIALYATPGSSKRLLKGVADELDAALRASQGGRPIDNGNTFIFCDYVQTRHTIAEPRGCIRGAGHSGQHVVQQMDDTVRAPVLLTLADEASAPSEGVPDTKIPLRAEENQMSVNTSSPPQEPTGDSSETVPEYLTYAFQNLRAAIAKLFDAPASSAHHERSTLLALQLERIPTLQEWNESWGVDGGPREMPEAQKPATTKEPAWDLSQCFYCGQFRGHGHECATPAVVRATAPEPAE